MHTVLEDGISLPVLSTMVPGDTVILRGWVVGTMSCDMMPTGNMSCDLWPHAGTYMYLYMHNVG